MKGAIITQITVQEDLLDGIIIINESTILNCI